MENTYENRMKLAWEIVDAMDLGSCLEALTDRIAHDFEENDEEFREGWNEMFPSEG